MICKVCGKELKDGAKFCSGCGSKTENFGEIQNKGYCYSCMSKNDSGEEICSICQNPTMPVSAVHQLKCGTVLSNKFMVGKALGEGGFGITYIGRDLKLDMKVAIKEFFPNGIVNRSNVTTSEVTCSISGDKMDFFTKGKERFLREARILAKFSSEPGVVSVRDYFEENNTAYIIMEYLEGKDLKTYIEENKRLSPEKTIEILMPVMKSLIKVHSQGLIHRDISPDNIRITPSGVKLLDFGAAREVTSEANKSLSVMLKHGYAPEEQYRSKGEQGPWTDVYAICATMYKCITGITPDDATQRMFEDELKSISQLGVEIDKNIENAIMKGMAVYKKDRYQNIEELISALENKSVTPPIEQKAPVDKDKTVFVEMEENMDNKTVFDSDKTVFAEVDESELMRNVPVEHMEKKTEKKKKEKKKKSKKPLFIILGILAVIVVIAVIISMSGDSSDSSNNSSNSSKSDDSEDWNDNSTLDVDTDDTYISEDEADLYDVGTLKNGKIVVDDFTVDVGDDWIEQEDSQEICFIKNDDSAFMQTFVCYDKIDLSTVEGPDSSYTTNYFERGTIDGHDGLAASFTDGYINYITIMFICGDNTYTVCLLDAEGTYTDVDDLADIITFNCNC